MARFLKHGRSAEQSAHDAAKVQDTVRNILSDIETRGDRALLELSQRFANWAPDSFRLSEAEIARCMKQVTPGQLDDIRFAQKQIRNRAGSRNGSLRMAKECALIAIATRATWSRPTTTRCWAS